MQAAQDSLTFLLNSIECAVHNVVERQSLLLAEDLNEQRVVLQKHKTVLKQHSSKWLNELDDSYAFLLSYHCSAHDH